MSNVDKLKYNGVEYDLGKSIDASLTQSGQPADAKEVGDKLNSKVDKIDGKGLSSNDYTTDEKTKLAGIENGANKTLIDTTLVNTGQAADAKIVGDAIASEDKKALAAYVTDTASGAVASFADGADNIPMKDVLVHIEPVQEGSGYPSPDNVRPITGWTGAKVTRTGKNLLPSYAIGQQKTQNGITATANADGSITYVGTSTGTFWGLGNSTSILVKAGTYTLSARNNTDITINIVNAVTGTFIEGMIGSNSKAITFANDTEIYYYTKIASGKTVDTTATYQLELGSTATDYEPYSGQTYDITFPSEAGTIYGGTLDVTSGVLTVDRELKTLTDADIGRIGMSSGSGYYQFTYYPDERIYIRGGSTVAVCDTFPRIEISERGVKSGLAGYSGDPGYRFALLDSMSVTTKDEWAAFLKEHPVTFTMLLVTPITYQLTQQEITSLLGTNNVWADTGDIEVEYRADTKVYVDAKVAAAESNITTLQNNKVDKTTPLLNFDDTATDPLTDDGALANALRAFGILSDVIPSGGGTMYLKKILTKITEEFKTSELTFARENYEHLAANTSVTKRGKTVTIAIGALKNITQDTNITLFTLPEGYRPSRTIIQDAYTAGAVASSMRAIRIFVNSNGTVTANNFSTEAGTLNMYTTITYICA